MREGTYKLAGARDYQEVVATLLMEQPISIEHEPGDPGTLVFRTANGDLIGRLTERHPVSQALARGDSILHCSVNSVSQPTEARQRYSVNVRIVTGAEHENYEPAPTLASRSYPLGLVGESHYQVAIHSCRVGDPIFIRHETNNPYDVDALAAQTRDGRTIGYIPRESWLRAAILEEGRGVSASIKSLNIGEMTGVVLEVALDGSPIGETTYQAPPANRGVAGVASVERPTRGPVDSDLRKEPSNVHADSTPALETDGWLRRWVRRLLS